MKVDDICRVLVDKGRGHGKGAKVKVILIAPEGYDDPEPYYCQAIDGKTSYWYKADELEVIEREGMIRKKIVYPISKKSGPMPDGARAALC